MKLKERLAEEYQQSMWNKGFAGDDIDEIAMHFLAGFEAAREMAAKAAFHASDCDRRCMNDCNLFIGDLIEQLGEEEAQKSPSHSDKESGT